MRLNDRLWPIATYCDATIGTTSFVLTNDSFEYKADDQQNSFNVRNGESSHFEVSLIWPEVAHSSHWRYRSRHP
jgi:hypothetical protein